MAKVKWGIYSCPFGLPKPAKMIKRTETALEAIEKSRAMSVPMPDDIRAKLQALRGKLA